MHQIASTTISGLESGMTLHHICTVCDITIKKCTIYMEVKQNALKKCFVEQLQLFFAGYVLFLNSNIQALFFSNFNGKYMGLPSPSDFKIRAMQTCHPIIQKGSTFANLALLDFCVKVSDWIFLAGNEMTSLFHPT